MKCSFTIATISFLPFILATNLSATNKCTTSIWIKPDAQGFDGKITEIKPGATWTGPFETQKFGNAVKFSNSSTDFTKPISFDYTVNNGESLTYYDVSNAAGQPFKLVARDTTGGDKTCAEVGCPTGECKVVKTCSSSHLYAIQAC